MKQIQIRNVEEIEPYEEKLRESAEKARGQLAEILQGEGGIRLISRIKFEKIGFDPLDPERALNLIEQVNQTCTYLASLKAVRALISLHPDMQGYHLNLGTTSGTDIESLDGSIATEVFAATSPKSNRKLQRDMEKVRAVKAAHKYVFFACPGIPEGRYEVAGEGEVVAWSVGR